jgi:hypothetical protein
MNSKLRCGRTRFHHQRFPRTSLTNCCGFVGGSGRGARHRCGSPPRLPHAPSQPRDSRGNASGCPPHRRAIVAFRQDRSGGMGGCRSTAMPAEHIRGQWRVRGDAEHSHAKRQPFRLKQFCGQIAEHVFRRHDGRKDPLDHKITHCSFSVRSRPLARGATNVSTHSHFDPTAMRHDHGRQHLGRGDNLIETHVLVRRMRNANITRPVDDRWCV